MARYWSIAVVMFVVLAATLVQAGGEKEQQFKGQLNQQDPVDARGVATKVYTVTMKGGKNYIIDMTSQQMQCMVRVLDAKGKQLDEADGAGNLDARLSFRCKADGEYKVVATAMFANFGNFTLTVRPAGLAQAAAAAHAAMIGKDAPDFTGDFAVNGKPAWLSDLKGKVVLVNFWEMRSSSSKAILGKLDQLNKTHQEEGLAVVGVTFYPSDIGQKLGLDEKTGGVKTVDKADRKSDQALLRAFAKHHKLEHLLLAVPKQEALDVFSAYVVNGLPQMVLIDRKGMVRMIDINGERNLERVESEIKKLLEEK